MMRFSNLVMGLALGGLGVVSSMVGCGGDSTTGGGGSTGSGGGNTCQPGEYPCSPSCACKAGHDCLSLEDNKDSMKPGFRMNQLTITEPKPLASGIVKSVVAGGVSPSLPACNVSGQATFNWLLQFDLAGNKLKTGGAKPVMDATKGYDFVDETVMGIHLQPVTIDVTVTDGKFDVATGTDLFVPIYLDPGATQVVILPLKKARLFMGVISADNNCIGKYNAEGLKTDDNCLGTDSVPTFVNGAKLDGHITLEDADTVTVSSLSESLCVLLSDDPATYGDGGSPVNKCKRTGGVIDFKGNWCSTSDMANDCQDAVKLGGDFAASAAKINN